MTFLPAAAATAAVMMFLLFLFTAVRTKPDIGNTAGCLLCAAVFAACIKHRELSAFIYELWHSPQRWTVVLCAAFLAVCVLLSAVISVLMIRHADIPAPKDTPAIVLGCRVKRNGPSPMLVQRADAAYGYLCENPGAVCIASGGKGDDEPSSEAYAIKQRLVEKGIDESRIILEDWSVSTYTNMKNSLELMDRLGLPHEAVIITSGFHQFRAHIIAKRAGLRYYARSSRTKPAYLPACWLRELFGVVYTLIFRR